MINTDNIYKFYDDKIATNFMNIVAKKIDLKKGYCNVPSVFFSVYKVEIEQLIGAYYTPIYYDNEYYSFEITDKSKFVFSRLKYGF